MKQVFQSLSNGEVELINLPSPSGTEDQILIQTICSLVSKGTEKMLIEFGKKNLISKVKSQPAKSKELINKANEGPLMAIEAAKSKLDKPLLGYCNVGFYQWVKCKSFKTGDRVISNGPHAEIF